MPHHPIPFGLFLKIGFIPSSPSASIPGPGHRLQLPVTAHLLTLDPEPDVAVIIPQAHAQALQKEPAHLLIVIRVPLRSLFKELRYSDIGGDME